MGEAFDALAGVAERLDTGIEQATDQIKSFVSHNPFWLLGTSGD